MAAIVEVSDRELADFHHLLDDCLVVWRNQLGAAGPIDFYGIVAGRVVTGRHRNAATEIAITGRKINLFGAALTYVEHINAGIAQTIDQSYHL